MPAVAYLAVDAKYEVYSVDESVYLKHKSKPYKDDVFMTWHYGNPTSGLIMGCGKRIIIAGCGLSIYNIEQNQEMRISNEPDSILWTNGLHQDEFDDDEREFRFVALNTSNQWRVFRMNIITHLIEEL